nr:RHS repeat-associated core domain-containing protein [Frigoribacterium sp. CFBP 13712]
MSASGGLAVAGLDWLGARIYDPSTRGFLSTDPLAPVLGAGWAGNPYSYAGNDPMHTLDPLGLRPATDADLDAYAKANQGALADAGDWWGENWEYVAAGAAIAVGVGLMFTGVGGPVGMVLIGAASGALVSGGASVIQQKATTGDVDWGKVGVDAAIGGVMGGAAAGAGVFATSAMGARAAASVSSGASRAATAVGNAGGRIGTTAANAGQQAISRVGQAASSQLGRSVIANATVGSAGNTGTYMVTTRPEDWTWNGFAGAAGGGAISGTMSAVAGPAAARMDNVLTERVVNYGLSGGGNILGNFAGNAIAGEGYSFGEALIDGTSGAALSKIPGPDGGAGLGAHYASAAAGQQLAWGVDTVKLALETQEIIP